MGEEVPGATSLWGAELWRARMMAPPPITVHLHLIKVHPHLRKVHPHLITVHPHFPQDLGFLNRGGARGHRTIDLNFLAQVENFLPVPRELMEPEAAKLLHSAARRRRDYAH